MFRRDAVAWNSATFLEMISCRIKGVYGLSDGAMQEGGTGSKEESITYSI